MNKSESVTELIASLVKFNKEATTIASGTTAIACLNTNRNFIGIELDEEYCRIANERINETKKGI